MLLNKLISTAQKEGGSLSSLVLPHIEVLKDILFIVDISRFNIPCTRLLDSYIGQLLIHANSFTVTCQNLDIIVEKCRQSLFPLDNELDALIASLKFPAESQQEKTEAEARIRQYYSYANAPLQRERLVDRLTQSGRALLIRNTPLARLILDKVFVLNPKGFAVTFMENNGHFRFLITNDHPLPGEAETSSKTEHSIPSAVENLFSLLPHTSLPQSIKYYMLMRPNNDTDVYAAGGITVDTKSLGEQTASQLIRTVANIISEEAARPFAEKVLKCLTTLFFATNYGTPSAEVVTKASEKSKTEETRLAIALFENLEGLSPTVDFDQIFPPSNDLRLVMMALKLIFTTSPLQPVGKKVAKGLLVRILTGAYTTSQIESISFEAMQYNCPATQPLTRETLLPLFNFLKSISEIEFLYPMQKVGDDVHVANRPSALLLIYGNPETGAFFLKSFSKLEEGMMFEGFCDLIKENPTLQMLNCNSRAQLINTLLQNEKEGPDRDILNEISSNPDGTFELMEGDVSVPISEISLEGECNLKILPLAPGAYDPSLVNGQLLTADFYFVYDVVAVLKAVQKVYDLTDKTLVDYAAGCGTIGGIINVLGFEFKQTVFIEIQQWLVDILNMKKDERCVALASDRPLELGDIFIANMPSHPFKEGDDVSSDPENPFSYYYDGGENGKAAWDNLIEVLETVGVGTGDLPKIVMLWNAVGDDVGQDDDLALQKIKEKLSKHYKINVLEHRRFVTYQLIRNDFYSEHEGVFEDIEYPGLPDLASLDE